MAVIRDRRRTGLGQPEKVPLQKVDTPTIGLRDAGTWALMLCATLVAYLPALRGGLLWDDNMHVTRADLRSLHGLWRIWFDLGATQQYYPLLHSAFWLEHRIWGDAVRGYHLTNVALHAVSACLVVMIVRRLSLPGAWLAGFVFALHPVCVEAVAWISEQKSTLSGVFYLKFLSQGRLWDTLLGGYSLSWNFSVWAPTPMSLGYAGGTFTNPVTGAVGARQTYPNYEPNPGNDLNLIQVPQLRDGWQDIGTNRFVQNSQNPLVTNCGTTPILQPNGATVGNQCVVVAPSFTRGNMPSNFWIEQRIIGANTSIYKDFPIKERVKAQIRFDYYNPFKWFNWGTVNTTMTQTNPASFMTPGLNDFGDSTEGGPSQVHLSLRIRF